MKRTKKLKVDAILTADWHLREDSPTCWKGDFWKEQWDCVKQVAELQSKYDCPVLHGGDLFHHWKASPRLLRYAMQYLPANFKTIYGQHDLPQHSLELSGKCGVDTLVESGHVEILNGAHWGIDPNDAMPVMIQDRSILVWHHLTYTSAPFPGAKDGMAEGLLRKHPQFDLILTGDNHQAFTVSYKKSRLVNPGNLTRQVANQIDFRPRVYLWNARANKVKPYYLDIKPGQEVISRQHIEQKKERDERISAFVERLGTEWEADLDFEENLKRFEQTNDVKTETMDIIYESLEK